MYDNSSAKNNKISASARRIYDKCGVQLKPCATPRPLFRKPTSPSLIARLYAAYSKLLKLTLASNAGGARRLSG